MVTELVGVLHTLGAHLMERFFEFVVIDPVGDVPMLRRNEL